MKKIIIPVIAILTGALGFGAIKLYTSDSLILNKAEAPQEKNREHMSHRSHYSHYSQHYTRVTISSDTVQSVKLNKEQVELFTKNIVNENFILKVDSINNIYINKCFIIKKLLIGCKEYEGSRIININNLIHLPTNELCVVFDVTFSYTTSSDNKSQILDADYTFMIPMKAKYKEAYVIQDFKSSEIYIRINKSKWMKNLIDSFKIN